MRLGCYEIHTAREGFASIRHTDSGEIMHSRTPPEEEAETLYVEQSCLAGRLCGGEGRKGLAPLVVWDVGLGAAANAMAAIRCFQEAVAEGRCGRDLVIYSFENDLDPFRLAMGNAKRFPYLREEIAGEFLRDGRWVSEGIPKISWERIDGDFVETMGDAPLPPDIIFYDLFSGKTHPRAWLLATFQRLFAICRESETELVTYTCSTAARAAMIAAGFWVARGRNAGEKKETTLALTQSAVRERHELLGEEWLAKWRRSTARFPADVGGAEREETEKKIFGAPQFQSEQTEYTDL